MSKEVDCVVDGIDIESWNPTAVTHSCSGNFTGPDDCNLIIAKSTLIEIHLVTPGTQRDLKHICNVPIYEGIGILEVFRPSYETADLLFIATKTYKYHVLQWDATAKEIIKRVTGVVSHPTAKPCKHDGFRPTPGEICTFNIELGLIGLYVYTDLFTLIRFNNQGQFEEPFFIRLGLEVYRIFDVKFVYGFQKPTICVICQSTIHTGEFANPHAKFFEVKLSELCFKEFGFPVHAAEQWPHLLIQMPPPSGGVLIIGKEVVVYACLSGTDFMPLRFPLKRAHERNLFGDRREMLHLFGVAHGRIDASTYLIGDHSGQLYLLEMLYRYTMLTKINVELLGETSIASTISCIEKDLVFVGSRYGDSQLIRLKLHPGTKRSEVLKSYINLDPVADFCVADLERQGLGLVLTCSGGYKNGSLRIVRNETRLCRKARLELEGVKGMWSIKSTTDDVYDKLLVVSLVSETRIFAMRKGDDPEYMLEEITIEGFCSDKQTLFCHTTAVDNQVVQVTLSSVRLVSLTSGQLLCEWHADHCISVATANATQVLVAIAGRQLVYFEIGDGHLFGEKSLTLKQDISCLDINSIGENANQSNLAAVGT